MADEMTGERQEESVEGREKGRDKEVEEERQE